MFMCQMSLQLQHYHFEYWNPYSISPCAPGRLEQWLNNDIQERRNLLAVPNLILHSNLPT